ncbi:11760_t:CDS:2 [Ambispora gerdemannii]|uniref:11760_t:CDS:1 n=1 Tax=Ambispora gerdemannii TaxID=144530 RepID=A0A9N8V1G3_9GLOM|nr:11760_t:CDS:2 [Ambispora gerdemannii]
MEGTETQSETQEEFPDLPELVQVPKPNAKIKSNNVAPDNEKDNEPEAEPSKLDIAPNSSEENNNDNVKESRKVTVVDCEEVKNNDIKNNVERGEANVGPRDEDADLIYDPSRLISHRIEIAVQRYKKNRKFNHVRNQVFEAYMRFGGIETGPKPFLGQDGVVDAEADAEEILAHRATNYVEEDRVEEMEVDFTYTATVYLSNFLIDKSGYVYMDQFREAPEVVISFINYLVNQRVCPEYNDDMQRALDIAKRARIELPKCKLLAQSAPGRFNRACSLLFGGELFGLFDDAWGGEEEVAKMLGISMSEAASIFKEVMGRENTTVRLNENMKKVSEEMDIIDIDSHPISTPFDPIDSNNTRTLQENSENSHATINSTSSATLTENGDATTNSNGDAITNSTSSTILTENGANFEKAPPNSLFRMYIRKHGNPEDVPIPVLLGPEQAKNVMPGMLVTADFYQLDNGFWYWDRVTNVYPSYFLKDDFDSDDDE